MDVSIDLYDTLTWDHCLERDVEFSEARKTTTAAKMDAAATLTAPRKSSSEKTPAKERCLRRTAGSKGQT